MDRSLESHCNRSATARAASVTVGQCSVSASYPRPKCDRFLTAIKAPSGRRSTVAHVTFALSISSRNALPAEPLIAGKVLAIIVAARRLRADAQAGRSVKTLRGKNLALLLSMPAAMDAANLRHAAQELGIRVADVRFTEPATPGQDDVQAVARMLGRMYDAIDCGTLAASTVRQIEREAGVPVYDGLGSDNHPVRAMADLMTLCEHRFPPEAGTALLFLGDAQTFRGRAFVAAAREIGFEVRIETSRREASNDASVVVDATQSPDWSLQVSGNPVDEARRSENHRCVIQTMLIDTIAKA